MPEHTSKGEEPFSQRADKIKKIEVGAIKNQLAMNEVLSTHQDVQNKHTIKRKYHLFLQ